MPHVDIRWRPYEEIQEEQIRSLAKQMPNICAPALSVLGGRQYPPSGIVVKVNRQSDMDINIPPILIEVFATGTPEQIARRHEARQQIIDGIRTHMGNTIVENDGSVWLLLPETSFGHL